MARLRMLMLSPVAPWPATTGGMVRIAALLSQMARHFDVTFVAPRRPGQALPAESAVRFVCPAIKEWPAGRKVRALLSLSKPFHVAFYSCGEIARLVDRELSDNRYDVVFGHFIYSLEYLERSSVPVVIDQQNVDRVYWNNKAEHSGWPMSTFASWNASKTIAYESLRLRRIWAYVSVSDDDRRQTRAYADDGVRHFWVAPNGVDTARFIPGPAPARADGVVTLGYLGSMDLQMNVEAVDRFVRVLLPRVRQALGAQEVRFLVIGSSPAATIRQLSGVTPGMVLSGTVPDVVPWLQQVDILVCPLRIGAGTKLKVAEAMSCGRPVVGTSMAFAGLSGESGKHYVIADTDEGFVDAVCTLVKRPSERAAIARNARELACVDLDWRPIGERLAANIREALASR